MVEFCRRWFAHVCPIILEGSLWRIDKAKDSQILRARGRSKKTMSTIKRDLELKCRPIYIIHDRKCWCRLIDVVDFT